MTDVVEGGSRKCRTPCDEGDVATQIGYVFGMERNEFLGRHYESVRVARKAQEMYTNLKIRRG